MVPGRSAGRCSQSGFSLISLLIALLVLTWGFTDWFRPKSRNSQERSAEAGRNAESVDRTTAYVCRANRLSIEKLLQIYEVNNPPMTVLDLEKLFAPKSPPRGPVGSRCSYFLGPNQEVRCTIHGTL